MQQSLKGEKLQQIIIIVPPISNLLECLLYVEHTVRITLIDLIDMKTFSEVKETYFNRTEEQWCLSFKKKKDEIEQSICVYKILKSIISPTDTFSNWVFLAYYGMGGKLQKKKKEKFFGYFQKDIKQDLGIAKKIVNDINGDHESCSYFSFVTKMLNMRDESFFPIYDSRIARKAFGCTDEEYDLESREKCYKEIGKLYNSIEDDDISIIQFRKHFPNCVDLGKMRILDFILYNTI